MIHTAVKYRTAIATAFVWAFYYFFTAITSSSVSPVLNGLIIRILTFGILLIILLVSGGINALKLPLPVVLTIVLGIGFVSFLLDTTAFLGLAACGPGVGTLVLKSDVIMINLATCLIDRERFTLRDRLLTAVTLAGVFLVLEVAPGDLAAFPPQALFLFASAFFVTLNAFLIRHVQRKYQVQRGQLGFYNNCGALLFFSVARLITGDGAALPSLSGLAVPFLLAALGQSLVYLFYYRSMELHPVWIVKIILLLIPVLNMAASFFVYGTPITLPMVAGALLVILGAGGILAGHRGETKINLVS